MSALRARVAGPAAAPVVEPVRVCFMIDRLSRAGTESQLLALIRELDRTQVQPSLVLLDGEDDLSRALEPADCPVLRLGVRRLISLTAAKAARRLRAFFREQRPDVLQVYFLDAAYFGADREALGVKKVVRVRNNLGTGSLAAPSAGRLVRPFVDQTLTNTEAGRRALIEVERHRSERLVVLRTAWIRRSSADSCFRTHRNPESVSAASRTCGR